MSKSNLGGLCCFRSKKSCSPSPPPQLRNSLPKQVVVSENGRPSQEEDKAESEESRSGEVSHRLAPSPAGDCGNEGRATSESVATPVCTEDVRLVTKSGLHAAPGKTVTPPGPASTADTQDAERQPALKSPPLGALPTNGNLPSWQDIAALLAEARQALAEGNLSPEMEAQLSGLVARLEAVTNRLEFVATKGPASGSSGSEEVSPFVVAFDEIIDGPVKQFITCSEKIGGDVKTQAKMVKEAFQAQRQFLVIASKSRSPSQDVLLKLLEPTSKKLQEIEEFVSKNRRSDYFNHLSAVSSSVPALGWVTISPAPAPFVKDMLDSGQFYLNRVLRDFKDKDKIHSDWATAWKEAFSDLQAYVKQHHTTGLTWNPRGGDASQAAGTATTQAPPPVGGAAPPPPPPPGPPPPDLLDNKAGGDVDEQRNALFEEISRGADITKGLKKVTDDMKTHKNPNLRLQTPQPYKPKPSPKPGMHTFGMKKIESVKPAKCVLEDKKWVVEYQHGNRNLVISDTNIRQTVYIFKCDNSTIQIKGKVNSIAMDNCKKTALLFEDVISSFDVVNCNSVQAQVTGKINTINIDKTDGCQVYLSQSSKQANIICAKSSEMNILVPDDSGEFKEFALPEQFRSVWNGKRFVTEPTDIVG